MRGAAMSLSAAASGFVVFLLSVSVVQGQDVWAVTYTPTEICALKGSAVNMSCTYTYPSSMNGQKTTVEEATWFVNMNRNEPVDVDLDPQYSGRVNVQCGDNDCTLRITDLRESDSAEYKFKFKLSQHNKRHIGSPGVTLTVTDGKDLMGPSTTTTTATRVTNHHFSVAGISAAVLLLAAISLSVYLWIRTKRTSNESSEAEERADSREQTDQEEQGELSYASIHFSNNRADPSPLYSNHSPAGLPRHMEQQEVSEYAAVRFNSGSTAPRT